MYDNYKRDIPIPGSGGRPISGILTYVLINGDNPERNILLIPFENRFLNHTNSAGWDVLKSLIKDINGGNFLQDKSVVNFLKENPKAYAQLNVAIHHFGPVPVLMTGYKVQLPDMYSNMMEVEVAMYYSRSPSKSSIADEIYPNKSIFLNSLIDDYDVIMQRYFEDVAAELNSIINAGLKNAIKKCKSAEDFIGKSIQSKLRDSVPVLEKWQTYNDGISKSNLGEDDILCCNLFDKNYSQIFLAQYFRVSTLYLINVLYSHIGLEDKSAEYYDKLLQITYEINAYLGYGNAEQIIENHPSFTILNKLISEFALGNIDALYNIELDINWLKSLTNFIKFLAILNQNKVDPIKGRIFVSHTHKVYSAEHLKKQLKEYYKAHAANKIEILTVEALLGSQLFIDEIRVRIWQTDCLLIIIPCKDEKLGSNIPSQYDWLVKEAEHGLRLDKKVIFLLEDGVDKSSFEDLLGSKEVNYLSPSEISNEDRARRLLNYFRQNIHIVFTSKHDEAEPNWDDLKADMKKTLEYNITWAVRNRHDNLVRGYLMQFPKNTLIVLSVAFEFFSEPYRPTKEHIAKNLYELYGRHSYLPFKTKSEARSAVDNAWGHIKNRSLKINDKSYTLMEQTKESRSSYLVTFSKMLRALQPDIEEERLFRWAMSLCKHEISN